MITVKVKSKGYVFIIPVPYAVLRMGSSVLTTRLVQRKMKDWMNKSGGHVDGDSSRNHDFDSDGRRFGTELLLSILENASTQQTIRQLIKDLQQCKGTVLVDVQAQDGTKVLITL